MTKNGFQVMDSDMHIIEPADLWERYMAPEFRGRVTGLTRYERDLGVALDGENLSAPPTTHPLSLAGNARERAAQNAKYQDGDAHGWDAHSQIRAMDTEGIDVAVLYPSRALFTLAYDGMDPKLAAAIGRAYNDWMSEFCQAYPDRLFGAGHIAPHDVDAAVAETRRCVEELGLKAVFLRPNIVNGIPWHDPYYDPLWGACERLGIPVGFHEGGPAPAHRPGGRPRVCHQHAAPHLLPCDGHDAGHRELLRRRHFGTFSHPAGGLPGGELLLGPLVVMAAG